MSPFKLHLFGTFALSWQGQPITSFQTDKVRALLAYLIVEANRSHRRSSLATLLWSEKNDKTANTNLRVSLSRLRQTLAPMMAHDDELPLLVITRQQVQCNLKPDQYWVDVLMFEQQITACQTHPHQALERCLICIERLTQAVDLYQGDFLTGLNLVDSPLFDEWKLFRQEQYHQQAMGALQTLTEHHLKLKKHTLAEQYARQQLSLEPWCEVAHRALMTSFAHKGQRNAARQQYETCREWLRSNFGVEPDPKTQQLYQQIQNETFHQPVAVTVASPKTISHNLPRQHTPLIGREKTLQALTSRLIDPVHSLISVVGAGGIGKTRLALAAAWQVRAHFKDGVWFVPLTGLSPSLHIADDITNAITQALNLTFYNVDNLVDSLLTYLADKNLLLVLDNFEHLLVPSDNQTKADGIDLILALLKQAPHVSILVTSRERLKMRIEYVFPITGLPVPPIDALASSINYSSGQLFVERAKWGGNTLTLDPQTQLEIGRICHFLEGIPLAIVLAAEWVSDMSCAEIAQTLKQNIDFLATSMRDMPARHRSIRAVFNYSWQLLSPTEQQTLQRLTVFRGSFSEEAAEVISQQPADVLNQLEHKSLIRKHASNRYDLHELLRQFAEEKLHQTSPEEVTANAMRHAHYYDQLVGHCVASLRQEQAQVTLADLKQDRDNIRAAWQWAIAQHQFDLIEPTIDGLANFYYFAGLLHEGATLFRESIEQIEAFEMAKASNRLQLLAGKLLVAETYLLAEQTKLSQTIDKTQQLIALGQSLNAPQLLAAGYMWGGRVFYQQGETELARQHLIQALSLAQQANLPEIEIRCNLFLGYVYRVGNHHSQGVLYLEQALTLCRTFGYLPLESRILNTLGLLAFLIGNYAQAEAYLKEGLQQARALSNRLSEAIALENLGQCYSDSGRYEEAVPLLKDALIIYQESGDLEGVGYTLIILGQALVGLNRMDEATEYYQQAFAVCEQTDRLYFTCSSWTGLAEVSLLQGDLAQAKEQAQLALAQFYEKPDITGWQFWIYWVCYRVFEANNDPQAVKLLQQAYQALQTYATHINSSAEQAMFLEAVPIHRQLIAAWEGASKL